MAVLNVPNSAAGIQQPHFNTGSTNIQPTAQQLQQNASGLTNSVQYDNNKSLMNSANAFNQFMSDTAYQRTVADMQKAGINPVVAFGLGKGQLDSSLQSATASTWTNSGTYQRNQIEQERNNISIAQTAISGISDIARMFGKFL